MRCKISGVPEAGSMKKRGSGGGGWCYGRYGDFLSDQPYCRVPRLLRARAHTNTVRRVRRLHPPSLLCCVFFETKGRAVVSCLVYRLILDIHRWSCMCFVTLDGEHSSSE